MDHSSSRRTTEPILTNVIDSFADELCEFGVNKHTFKVPIGWNVNTKLLRRVVKARLDELS